MAQDWNISPRGNMCADCEKVFENNETYFSALVFGEDGYQRLDFCVACWVGQEAELNPFSSWKGTYILPPPPEEKEEPLKKENAESLLRRLIEDDDAENAGVIYILAVMLERKKELVEKDVKIDEDGTVHRIYEHRKTGETFLILDPQLKLDRLQDVQMQVAEMLGFAEKKTEEDAAAPQTTSEERGTEVAEKKAES